MGCGWKWKLELKFESFFVFELNHFFVVSEFFFYMLDLHSIGLVWALIEQSRAGKRERDVI